MKESKPFRPRYYNKSFYSVVVFFPGVEKRNVDVVVFD